MALLILTAPEKLSAAGKGKLDVGDPAVWWETAITATTLPLRPHHVGPIPQLSTFHQDPFDRVLIAQAIMEGLTLITTDAIVARYASDGLKVLR